ncbi:MAG: glutaminase [Gammaproteobacteria bacterium]|nr:glutaminase [Gammaproteobacteria bacterium]
MLDYARYDVEQYVLKLAQGAGAGLGLAATVYSGNPRCAWIHTLDARPELIFISPVLLSQLGLGVFSPSLNEKGKSVRGVTRKKNAKK